MPKSKLEIFLEANEALEQFKTNLINEWKPHNASRRAGYREYTPEIHLEEHGAGYFGIKAAFHWAATPEGHDYWKDLHGKFVEELNATVH